MMTDTGIPYRVGDYRLVQRLGVGGMGQVYLGHSPSGLPVAVKLVHDDLAGDRAFRARFAREVAAARAVSGAFTAPVIDADPDGEPPWLVTLFLPGLSLQEAIGSYGPMPPQAVVALGAGLAEALRSIHEAGVVHRDLKPSNIMLCPDGPKVIDFGIAHTVASEAITRTGAVVGTPGYMSPEQAGGRESGPAGDVFSLGGVLVYAATGNPPYGRGDAHAQIYRILHGAPGLDAVRDPALRGLIEDCLATDPAARPTPHDLLARLSGPPRGTDWLPAPIAAGIGERTVAPPRRRFFTRLPVLFAGIFAVAALIYGLAVLADSGSGGGSGDGCDTACEHAHMSAAAFYGAWNSQIEWVARLCAEGAPECPGQTASVIAGLTREIGLRADAAHYARPRADLAELSRRLPAYRACPSCRPRMAALYDELLALDNDLFAVPSTP